MKLKKRYRVKIRGKRWVIIFRKCSRKHKNPQKGEWGCCLWRKRKIFIDPRAKGLMLLDTILHEVRHAHHLWMDEEYVRDYATEEAKILRKLGYKRR